MITEARLKKVKKIIMDSIADKELRVHEENLINNFFADVEKLINKPVETTNEQSKSICYFCHKDPKKFCNGECLPYL